MTFVFRINAKPLHVSHALCLYLDVLKNRTENLSSLHRMQGGAGVRAMSKRRLPLIRFNSRTTGFLAFPHRLHSRDRHKAPALGCQLPWRVVGYAAGIWSRTVMCRSLNRPCPDKRSAPSAPGVPVPFFRYVPLHLHAGLPFWTCAPLHCAAKVSFYVNSFTLAFIPNCAEGYPAMATAIWYGCPCLRD